jgi:hypothetical protein
MGLNAPRLRIQGSADGQLADKQLNNSQSLGDAGAELTARAAP